MNPVVHFEMSGEDTERMKEFYSKVFGWKMVQMGAEMGNYIIAQTTETDDKGMVQKPGAINGGFYKRSKADQTPHIVISVDDLQASIQKVKDAGGKNLGGGDPNKKTEEAPDDIPGVGLYVTIVDSEGNKVGMLQPKR